MNGYEILQNVGKIQKEVADKLALNEFEQYKVSRDREFISDFDKVIEETKKIKK